LAKEFGQLKTSSTQAVHREEQQKENRKEENQQRQEIKENPDFLIQSPSPKFANLTSTRSGTTLFHQFPVRAQAAHAPSLTRGIGAGALTHSSQQPQAIEVDPLEFQPTQVPSFPTTSQKADQQDQLAAYLLLRHQQQQMPAAFSRQMGLFGMPALGRMPPQQAWFQQFPCAMQQQQQYFTFGSTPSSPTTSSLYDCYSDSEPLSPLPQKFPPVVNS
jgi:hypothetical protein